MLPPVADLTSTAGAAALVAGGIALVALLVSLSLALKLRRLRRDQSAVMGEGAPRDLIGHAHDLQREIGELATRIDELGGRTDATGRRLDGAITHSAVVRYDAHGELSGQQSSSVALLDEHRNGVVLSSILHREQARLYAKPLAAGESDIRLSPEEQAAIEAALEDR
jgi:uncharacterized protein DUF4446